MNKSVFFAGALLGAALVTILSAGLGKNPNEIRSPLVGRPAPDFALREVGTGTPIDLTRFKGKPVVVNFWATWCGPCWEEHPILVANARRLGSDVQFLGVVFQDKEETILNFLRQRGSSYPTVVDDNGKTAIAYGVGGVPETFFIDAEGVIRAKHSGPLTADLLTKHVGEVLR